jgi:hypothetical protein
MGFQNNRDFLFSAEGDFYLDESRGDLADTKNYQHRDFQQKLLTRIQSKKGDWKLQQDVGTGLSRFVGQPNTREVGERIKNAVYNDLVNSKLLSPEELLVDVIPISEEAIMVVLLITPPGASDRYTYVFSYSMKDDQIVPRS